jgi:hypothetical protein
MGFVRRLMPFLASAVVSAIVSASPLAYALNDRISPLSCMSNNTNGAFPFVAVSGMAVNACGIWTFAQCGYTNPSFYTATSVGVTYYQTGQNLSDWTYACIQHPYSQSAYCGSGVATGYNPGAYTIYPPLSWWTSSRAGYWPYILLEMQPGDYATSILVQ